MATAMHAQGGNPAPRRSVAVEKFWRILPYPKTPDSDNTLHALVEVCTEEACLAAQDAAPDQYCFGVMATVRGRWAAQAAADPHMTMAFYPKTKRRLCNYIADGWLGTRSLEDEAFFAGELWRWPANEAKHAADVVRSIIEFRWNGEKTLLDRFGRFFASLRLESEAEMESDDIPRTVLKAIARHGDIANLLHLGETFHLLRGPAAPAVRSCISAASAPRQ